MKNLYLRPALALACALSLSACGGDDDGTFALQGTVSGVNMAGLVLQNNGAQDLEVAANTGFFSFPQLIGTDTQYNVTVKSSPPNATCEVFRGKGKSTIYGVGLGDTAIAVICTLKPHNVTGTVSGNTGDMVLINGSDRITVPANQATFSFTRLDPTGKFNLGTVGEGQPYGLQVLTPPAGRSCLVVNGTGTMGTADVTNVQITCS